MKADIDAENQPEFWEFKLFNRVMSLKGVSYDEVITLALSAQHDRDLLDASRKLARQPGDELLATTRILSIGW